METYLTAHPELKRDAEELKEMDANCKITDQEMSGNSPIRKYRRRYAGSSEEEEEEEEEDDSGDGLNSGYFGTGFVNSVPMACPRCLAPGKIIHYDPTLFVINHFFF